MIRAAGVVLLLLLALVAASAAAVERLVGRTRPWAADGDTLDVAAHASPVKVH